jgi:hypothetical protein
MELLHSHSICVWLEEVESEAIPRSEYFLNMPNVAALRNQPDPTARERHGFSFFAHVSSKLSSLIFPQVRRHLVQAAVRHFGSIARRHLALPHWRCQSFSHPPPPLATSPTGKMPRNPTLLLSYAPKGNPC